MCYNTPGRLESLLELVTRITTANSDPYKDNLRVALLPYDLIFQMGKILAIDTAEEAEYQVRGGFCECVTNF